MLASSPSAPASSPALRTSRVIKHTPFFYGWVIVVVGTLGSVMMGPSQTFTVSLFIDSFVADLGMSRAGVSLFYGMATLAASLMLPVTGRLVDRYGSRTLIVVNALLFGLAVMALSAISGPLSFLFTMLAVRFLGFGSMQLVSSNVIAQWFIRRRGLVMGLSGQALAISLFIYPALSNALIGQFGWRGAWVALGALALAVMLPVGWLFFRDRPELYGVHPDGVLYSDADDELGREDNWTLAEARSTPLFWVFAAGIAAISMLLAGMVFHQAALFAARGMDRSMVVAGFQMTALFVVVGNLGMGYLMDRYSPRRLLQGALLVLGAAMLLVQMMSGWAGLLAYTALNGLCSGSYRVIDATVWAKYFGRRHLGSIRGATMIGTVGGAALGAYPLGLSYDLTGSYAPALTALLLLPAAIILAAFWVKRPTRRGVVAQEAAYGQ
jgi:MFS family permease